jgi:hypothetical protein
MGILSRERVRVVGGVDFEGLALSPHTVGASLYHVALDALTGDTGGGSDGSTHRFNGAQADIVALGVVFVVVAALAL